VGVATREFSFSTRRGEWHAGEWGGRSWNPRLGSPEKGEDAITPPLAQLGLARRRPPRQGEGNNPSVASDRFVAELW